MNQLKEQLEQANAKIAKLEQSIEQLQDALEKQAKLISSQETETTNLLTWQDGLSEEGPAKTMTGWWQFTSKEQQHPEGVLLAQTSEDGVLKDIKHHTKELADITSKITDHKTFQQKVEGEIKL